MLRKGGNLARDQGPLYLHIGKMRLYEDEKGLKVGGGVENFYAVVTQLKTYHCVQESSRIAVCVQAWAETMRVFFRNLGVIAIHQGRSHTPGNRKRQDDKTSGYASATSAHIKTPVHCAE